MNITYFLAGVMAASVVENWHFALFPEAPHELSSSSSSSSASVADSISEFVPPTNTSSSSDRPPLLPGRDQECAQYTGSGRATALSTEASRSLLYLPKDDDDIVIIDETSALLPKTQVIF